MGAPSHAALLEVQRVQLTDRSRTLREVIHQFCLMDGHFCSGEALWVKVHDGHGAALFIGPHCDLSPVTPGVEQQAGLQ